MSKTICIYILFIAPYELDVLFQEKQRAKMKEKLDKYVKDTLLDLCDLFDLPVSKANTRKVSGFTSVVYYLMSKFTFSCNNFHDHNLLIFLLMLSQEDLVAKLLDFLVAPHPPTSIEHSGDKVYLFSAQNKFYEVLLKWYCHLFI